MSSEATDSNNHADVNSKKRKRENEECGSSSIFSNFTVEKVLREDVKHKVMTVQGSFVDDDDNDTGESVTSKAVVILERKPFDSTTLQNYLRETTTLETLNNDIYTTHNVFPQKACADIKATVIHPATEKHIAKYSDHEAFVIHETPDLYNNVTLPCLLNSKFSIQWVYNILNKTTESERIVVEDPDSTTGFVMLPDMKWDRKNMDALYLIAIVHKQGLKSIRDLNKEHLPLLKNILEKGQTAIQEQFGIPPEKLRIYFHYQPSYYHLHIHFTHIQYQPPGSEVMRAHLIEDVIGNIEIDSDFYTKKTLTYVVTDNHDLFRAFKNSGYLK